jgi:hypothetical protein
MGAHDAPELSSILEMNKLFVDAELTESMGAWLPMTYTPDLHLNTCGHHIGPTVPTSCQLKPSTEVSTCRHRPM